MISAPIMIISKSCWLIRSENKKRLSLQLNNLLRPNLNYWSGHTPGGSERGSKKSSCLYLKNLHKKGGHFLELFHTRIQELMALFTPVVPELPILTFEGY